MGKKQTFDFSGWATKNNVKCSDGRVIRKDAFKHNDGEIVPLVWNHNHRDADNVLGHALLENREEGVYAYCSFNDTEQGRNTKELVKHGDIRSLSIYANRLKQNGDDVVHGEIREVSLVLAGANPLAKIENVMVHGEDNTKYPDPERAVIKGAVQAFEFDIEKEIVEHASKDEKKEESSKDEEGKSVQAIVDSMTDEQRTAMYAIVGAALEEVKADKDDDQEEKKEMKQNAFDMSNENGNDVIAHSEIVATIEQAKKQGSMRDAFKELCLQHGITNIDVLFPDAKAIANTPATINDDTSWVNKVMSKVHHTPFSRVKMLAFDITGEEARARGYVKGNKKEEEVIAALRRETSPQTVYKLQKLDRDDIIDITDLDVVAYLKQEMRGKLNEELARAYLTGDGRSMSSKDKINPQHIRPILGDDSTYVVAKHLEKGAMDNAAFAKYVIKQIITARKEYKGSGNPTWFTSEDILTEMLLLEDKNGRIIYDTIEKLKTTLRVSDIVTPPYFSTQSRTTDSGDKYNLIGILVNLNDYNVGADKGGQVNMFDDFDLNFNKYEYLIETRCSGAMVKPFGAITFEEKVAKATETTAN